MDDHHTVTPVSTGTDSTGWQATAKGERTEQLAAYLETVSTLPHLRQVAAQALAMLGLTAGQQVLEVGCGNGVFLPLLAAAVGVAGSVDAIDLSPPFVIAARERVTKMGLAAVVAVQEGDAYRLPFADATFDAAHCERLLMHLDAPTAALHEMRRVVKPGGWVVAAEPDWLGTQIDHPDDELMAMVFHRAITRNIRQPHMGLTLNRRMHEVGLVRREAVPVMDTNMTYRGITQYGFSTVGAAAELVAEGKATREQVDALLVYLDTASAQRSFWSYGSIVVAAGQVPAPRTCEC